MIDRKTHQTLHLVAGTTPDTAEDKLNLIREKIEQLLKNRTLMLRTEARTLCADMGALAGRIRANGVRAQVDDMKAGRWYRTASDLRLLQQLNVFVCEVMGEPTRSISIEGEDGVPEQIDLDQVAED